MMHRIIPLAILTVSACTVGRDGVRCEPALPESIIAACAMACAPKKPKIVTNSRCECQEAAPSTASDAGDR